MEFYKQYRNTEIWALKKLNNDVENNPLWKSQIEDYFREGYQEYITVHWIGPDEMPFKGDEQ